MLLLLNVSGPRLLRGAMAISQLRSHSTTAASAVDSVDTDDVKRHARLAADWWNPNGPMRALHSLNSIR